jgi:hypothetical protein
MVCAYLLVELLEHVIELDALQVEYQALWITQGKQAETYQAVGFDDDTRTFFGPSHPYCGHLRLGLHFAGSQQKGKRYSGHCQPDVIQAEFDHKSFHSRRCWLMVGLMRQAVFHRHALVKNVQASSVFTYRN